MKTKTKARKVLVSITMPPHIHEAGKACAASIGQSFSSFATQAIAQRVSNWRDPITGKKLTLTMADHGELKTAAEAPLEDWVCDHPACSGPATECKRPEQHRTQGSWTNVKTGEVFGHA